MAVKSFETSTPVESIVKPLSGVGGDAIYIDWWNRHRPQREEG
jgi:hypothetical protein